MSRPPREHERPAFGSVWTWGEPERYSTRYLVVALDGTNHGSVRLKAIDLGPEIAPSPPPPTVTDGMVWGTIDGAGLHPLPQWRCVEEAPTLRSDYPAAYITIDDGTTVPVTDFKITLI